jgi:hypothetical protein
MNLQTAFEVAQHVVRSTTPELLEAEGVLASAVDSNNPDAWFPWGSVHSELDMRHRGAKRGVRATQTKVGKARQELEKLLSLSTQGRTVEAARKKLALAEAKFQDAQQRLAGLSVRAPKPRRRGVFYV